jgi:hypothetical protein
MKIVYSSFWWHFLDLEIIWGTSGRLGGAFGIHLLAFDRSRQYQMSAFCSLTCERARATLATWFSPCKIKIVYSSFWWHFLDLEIIWGTGGRLGGAFGIHLLAFDKSRQYQMSALCSLTCERAGATLATNEDCLLIILVTFFGFGHHLRYQWEAWRCLWDSFPCFW